MRDLDKLKRLSPGWLGAIAGAAAAGATIMPGHRILAALVAGGAMLVVAVKLTPCCDGCAQGAGCAGATDESSPGVLASDESSVAELAPAVSAADLFGNAAIVARAGKVGCA